MRTGRRTAVLVVAVALVVVLAGCSSGRPTDPPGSQSPTGPTEVRQALADGLRDASPTSARLVEDPATTLTAVDAPWLNGWQIYDVTNGTQAHPRRFYAALSDGFAEYLTGDPGGFAAMVAASSITIDSVDAAEAEAVVYLDSTRDFVAYAYRIDAVDDIEWLPKLNAQQTKQRTQITAAYGTVITEPVARSFEDGWRLAHWMVDGRRLVRHDLVISTDGVVTDTVTTVVDNLPVPESV